jgi:hypothetical protein
MWKLLWESFSFYAAADSACSAFTPLIGKLV